MSTKSLVLSLLNFRFEKKAGFVPLISALEGVRADEAAWQPHANSHSIWQIVNHIVFWNENILRNLQGNATPVNIDNSATFGEPGDPTDEASWQATVERMKEVCTNIQLTLSDWDESRFDTPYDNSALSYKLVLADLAMHDAYHIGQILYIRKLYAARTNQ
ncbi:DinB family protein [Polycladomyces subterraneus]|uniref:DinB family protein n=1 Tax=Polycladomyces subterraneus TaxID=1016997 RepID=A0ABT8ILR9_9BACL|nr:DinB family protein [Polycladomyces subterraneus]MDN4593665.1 DinB family protein [Polycladomyces subterraneus]